MEAGGLYTNYTFDRLLDEVLEKHQQPQDRYEIAAILESLGWNDDRASETFGVADVFELADVLWEKCNMKIMYTSFNQENKQPLPQLVLFLLRQFLRGTIFAVPMAVSVVSMLTLKYSLWSYEYLSVELATSIAMGTILSFIIVGGFTQAIARRGFFYIIQGYYNMAKKVTFHFITVGFMVCIAISAALLFVNSVVRIFPIDMVMIIILYFFFLNAIWLSVTVMYILKKELLFTGLIIMGIGIIYVLFQLFGVNIIVSQLIALMLVSTISILLVLYLFKVAERNNERGITPRLPKMSVTLYSTLPYFLYGMLYFSFLFVDRLIAWSRNTDFMPYIIWFRGDYELGLDFALLALIIPMGVSEVVLTKMMMDIERSQKKYWGDEAIAMNNHYRRLYFKRLIQVGLIAVVCAIALYLLLYSVLPSMTDSIGTNLFENSVTHFVFVVSLIAYALVATALVNAVILFSLSQPEVIVKSIYPAFIVNIVVGFLLSRWVDYHFAVLGLLAGAIVFVCLSSIQVVRVLRKLDYYLYAAS